MHGSSMAVEHAGDVSVVVWAPPVPPVPVPGVGPEHAFSPTSSVATMVAISETVNLFIGILVCVFQSVSVGSSITRATPPLGASR